EVERMVSDAEQNKAEDARIRLEVDARNSLDSMAYQVERKLADLGPAVPVHERSRAEIAVKDAREAIKEGQPADRLRAREAELQQILLAMAADRPAGDGNGQRTASNGDQGSSQDDDDVIDADFTVS